MANKKNKKAPVGKKKNQGFKTGKGAENKKGAAAPVAAKVLPGTKKRAIWITVLAVLALLGIGVGIFFGFFYEKRFSYLTSDLSKYINVKAEDYTDLVFNIPLVEYKDGDVERALAAYLVDNKGEMLHDGLGIKNLAIALGSEVSYYYRMYTVDENGVETDVPDHSNLSSQTAAVIEVGSYANLAGINEALLGVIPSERTPFERIYSGEVEEGDIVYLSYSSYSPTANKSVVSERVDLSREGLESTYGNGFIDYIKGLAIGDTQSVVDFPQGTGTIAYSNITVDFVTRCEDDAITVETVFSPTYEDDSSTKIDESTLRGTKVFVDIFVKNHVMYELPEYNDEFITETLGISEEELSSYKGENLKEKHSAYVEQLLKENIESLNDDLIEEKLLDHFSAIGEVIEYPESELEARFTGLYANVVDYYEQYGSDYESLDECVISIYGLSEGADWQQHLLDIAKTNIKDTLVFFYVANAMGYLPPSEAEYEQRYNERIDIELAALMEEHKDELAGLEGEEYDELINELKAEIIEVLGKDGIDALIYRSIATEKMVKYLVTVPQVK